MCQQYLATSGLLPIFSLLWNWWIKTYHCKCYMSSCQRIWRDIIWLTGSCPQCPLSVRTLSLLLAAKWHHTYLPAVILLVGYFLCCPSTEIGWGGCRQICQHLFGCSVLSLSGAIFSRYYLLNDTAIWYHWRYWKWIGPKMWILGLFQSVACVGCCQFGISDLDKSGMEGKYGFQKPYNAAL